MATDESRAAPVPEEEKLSVAVRVNLSPTELAQLQQIADEEDRAVAFIARRAIRQTIWQWLQLREARAMKATQHE